MKQYRLIKKYPDSPKLGTIVNSPMYEYDDGKMIGGLTFEDEELWETSKEFWEEVLPYQVISFIFDDLGINKFRKPIIYKLNEDGRYECDGVAKSFDFLINHSFFFIHSVKRLSDGLTFTLGELVSDSHSKKKIVKIQINKTWLDGLRIELEHESASSLSYIKKSIVIGEDGVELFDKDKYFYITQNDNIISSIIDDGYNIHSNIKIFSTKENAEEYILLNKQLFSVNDVIKIQKLTHQNSFNGVEPYNFREELKKIAANKI